MKIFKGLSLNDVMSLRGRVNDFVTKVQNLDKRAEGQKILEYTSSLWMTPIYFLVIPNQAEPNLS